MRAALPTLLAAVILVTACGKQSEPHPATANPPAPPAAPSAPAAPSQSTDAAAASRFFDPKANPDASFGAPLDPHQLTPSQLQYGLAPKRDPHVTYAPDVILMEDGDKAIRMAASDGITWVFDASAPHVSEFEEGKIVFATGRAVGRIGRLERSGDSVIVRLAPVKITDVVTDGHFIVDGPFHPKDFIFYGAPDFPSVRDLKAPATQPAMAWGTVDEAHLVRTAFIPVAAAAAGVPSGPPTPAPPAVIGQAPPFNFTNDGIKTFPGLEIYPVAGSDTSIGVEFDFNKDGVYLKSTGKLILVGAWIRFELKISHSQITKFGIKLGGAAAMQLEFESKSAQDRFVNAYLVADPSIDMVLPTPVAGLPLSLSVHTKFVFKTGFSAKTSTLSGRARYTLSGEVFIGKEDGFAGIRPKVEAKPEIDLADTIDGISVGINSMNLTFSVEPMIGIGAFGFTTGVYASVLFGGDVVKQSSVAMVSCRKGWMRAEAFAGVGYQLSGPFWDFVNTLLRSFTKFQLDKDVHFAEEPKPHLSLMNEATSIPPHCASAGQ